MAGEESRQVVLGYTYWLNAAGVWVPVTADTPLPVDPTPGTAGYEDGIEFGETTNAWVTVFNWDTRELDKKTIVLTNMDMVNDLDYRVYTLAWEAGQDFEEIPQITLLAQDCARIALNNKLGRIKVQVIDTVALSHALWEIGYIGSKH